MFSKSVAGALAAGAAIFLAGAAKAASVEDEFVRICLPANDAAEAITNARSAGYVAAPPELRARLKGFPQDGEVMWRAEEGRMSIFIGASVKHDLASSASQMMSGETCVIGALPAQPDLLGKIGKVLDVGEPQAVGKLTAYAFEQTENGRVRFAGTDKGLVVVKSVAGAARLVTVMERPGMSALVLMIPQIRAR